MKIKENTEDEMRVDDSVADRLRKDTVVYPGAIPLKKGDLAEYVSTFGSCFDREIEWENEEDCPGSVMVRGFALSAEAVAEDLTAILSAPKGTEE